MAPKYKLMYFNLRTLTEPIRFLFKYGKIEFEDYRYTEEEWLGSLKQSAPFGQGPLLEVDGDSSKTLWQSVAIQRHVAQLVGLAGTDEWERFQVDMMAETLWDLRCLLYKLYTDRKMNRHNQRDEVLNVQLPFLLGRLDKAVEENGGYFVNGKLSWPDLQYTAMFEYLGVLAASFDFEKPFLNLKQLRDRVSEIPQIKEWIEERPKSEW